MIKVVIVDDHPIVRRGIIQILEDDPVCDVIGEANNGAALLELLQTCKPDVILCDISMPGMSGIEVLKQVKSDYPRVPVLILSIHPEDLYAKRVLKAGGAGYLTKTSAPDELINAIKRVHDGKKYISANLAEILAYQVSSDHCGPRHEILSDREFEIMKRIGNGQSLTEAAENLCLSVKTVSTYRSRILLKMDFKTNADITRYVVENNLQ
jgi:two-component system invasion response regulator UvrY